MDPQQQQQQEMSSNSNTLENMLGCSKEKKPKPQAEHAQKCPRCESTNTKFCYYNNYSLSQPRYFCKSCRRYWTKGGTLRNVPVGGGCRKNKRSSSSSSSKRSQSQDQQPLMISTNQNPVLSHLASSYDSNDLTLAFARLQKQQQQQQQSGGHHLGFDHHDQFSNILGSAAAANQGGSFLDAMRCGYLETQNQNPNNFQTLYYGYEGNGEVENGSGSCGADVSGEMVLPYGHEMGTTTATTTAVTVTTMKQEMCNDNYRDQGSDQNRMLWGLPWQLNGDHHHHQSINMTNNVNNLGDLDSGRESWNGFAPSWHGLLNSPLM